MLLSRAFVAQRIEHRISNPAVAGSIPAGGAIHIQRGNYVCVDECK